MLKTLLMLQVRKIALCLTILCCFSLSLFAQVSSIKGHVADTSENKSLVNSSISVLRKSDSVLVAYTRSDNAGNFTVKRLSQGKYFVLITHPKYADFVENVDLSTAPSVDLGKVSMILKSQLLQEVIVKGTGAIRIKGDTTEFKVDSFYLKPGATVEDMLKKLPGMQVDKDGKISFQGQSVPKVLVDGEEFFSDDPTIVTKNMLSDAIDKVQVYDKKSDQAAFTGIDDGQKTKTIDLKLKDSRKQGYFGKVEAGSDFQKYWDNSAMLNAFRGKRKFALFGIMSNTGKTGLNFNESLNYGSSGNIEFMDGGGIAIYGGGDDFGGGNYSSQGLPKAWNAGALYSNKWDNDKIAANTGVQYKKLTTENEQNLQSKYILPDTLYYINEASNSYSSRVRNTLNGTYDYRLDSSSNLKLTASGFLGTTTNGNSAYSESLDEDGKFVNTSRRSTNSTEDNKGINASLLYRKKFKKQGRTLSVNVNQNYTSNESNGFLLANYKFYDASGGIKRETNTDQQKVRENSRSSINGRITYTQPLTKLSILEFSYGINNNTGLSSITTLGKATVGGKYEMVIDSLTNMYGLNVLTNNAGINYRYSKPKKVNFSFGGSLSRADFTRTDRRVDTSVNYHFLNVFPQANINYTLPNNSNIYFSYYGNTRAPSIDQIQPIKDNTDELNQRIGNPDLKQAFSQRFSLDYRKYVLLSDQFLGANLGYNSTYNDFSTISYVDALGKRITQPINVSGNHSYNFGAYYGMKIKNSPFRVGLDMNASSGNNTNYVNSLINKNKNINASISTRLSIEKSKKFEVTLVPGFTYVKSTSSIRPDEPTKYWIQNHYARMVIFLPKEFEINSDANFAIRQQTDAFTKNRNAVQWNASLDKKILKAKGRIRLSMFDILNQNIGFDRNVNSNFISERTYTRIQRYALLSFIYNFSKNGTPTTF